MRRLTAWRKLLALLLLAAAWPVRADFTVDGLELVHTAPLETRLVNPDLRDPVTVWCALFDQARHEIVLGQFYAVSQAGSAFERVLASLAAAGKRGVKIRFLLEQKGVGLSDPATLERLRQIPNLSLRLLDFGKLSATGIIHAKYLVVDAKQAYVGSQNFDWRSFSHIHETGLAISDATIVAQLQAIFEHDWQAQAELAAGRTVAPLNLAPPPSVAGAVATLVASPYAHNPPGVGDSETALVALLSQASGEVRITLLDYVPLAYGSGPVRQYYGVIDNALRAAAARGVTIMLLVSNWNLEHPGVDYLKSLAVLPHVQVRIITLPQASTGFIAFARVMHSKTMSIDGKLAWIGTSNWAGGYLDRSRNLEVIVRNAAMAARVAALHEQAWSSAYAAPLDINKDYPKPNKASAD